MRVSMANKCVRVWRHWDVRRLICNRGRMLMRRVVAVGCGLRVDSQRSDLRFARVFAPLGMTLIRVNFGS